MSASCVQGFWNTKKMGKVFCLFLKRSVSEAEGTLIRWHLWLEIINYNNAINEAKKELSR